MAGKKRLNRALLIEVCDGNRSCKEMAEMLGWGLNTVKRITLELDLPRRKTGQRSSVSGKNNPAYVCGRTIDHDGYALILAPENYPFATSNNRVREHRLVMEKSLGRYLDKKEVVDHIDGLTLHNDISNLRVFSSNAEHLKATVRSTKHSLLGLEKCRSTFDVRKDFEPVDTYHLRKKRGDVRLRQILLAALRFGIDSPHLLGTHYHLKRKCIDFSSHHNLKLEYQKLLNRYEQDLYRSE